jgi:hypothetical protein
MLALEDARGFLRDLVAAVAERYPDRSVPASVRQAIRTGRFPGEVHERIRSSVGYGGAASWEPVMETWLSDRLRLPGAISDAISATPPAPLPPALESTPDIPSADIPETPAGNRPRRPSGTTSATALQRARRLGRQATDDDLLEAIRELASSGVAITKYRVTKELPVGEKTAGRLIEAWSAERPSLHVAGSPS